MNVQILAITASLALLLGVIYLIRSRSLRVEYSILWLIGTLALLITSLWRGLLDTVAAAIGVYYAPAVLLLVGILFGVLLFLHLTVVISRHTEQNKRIVQELALLREKLQKMEGSSGGAAAGTSSNRNLPG
jgi:hypothetical protein